MEDPTSTSGEGESQEENANTNAVEETTDANKGEQQEVEAEKEEGSPEKETEADVTAEDLLKEAEIQPAEPEAKKNPDEQRVKQREKFKTERNDALNRVYAALRDNDWETPEDRKAILDKAINSERTDMSNFLKKEVAQMESGEATDPSEAADKELTEGERLDRLLDRRADSKNFTKLFPEICKKAEINKSTTFAIRKRKELLALKDTIIANQKEPRHAEALELAAAKLGLLSTEQIEIAKKAAVKLSKSALPPTGVPANAPGKTTYTYDEYLALPQESFEKVRELKAKGKVKVLPPK